MNLLDALANGVTGAAGGTAAIYRRGTSTFATLYANYDGTGSVTPTAPVSLDSNGRAVWYVNEEVDVIVRNASFTPVSTFTAMVTATDIEVRSQSFTGVDYSTAQSAANNPVTLATVLDRWKTSAGTIDWKVLVAGLPVTIQTALGGLAGMFFNVKDPTYGAAGDGSANDTSAISAAISACDAAGGGCVFFPDGTYRITTALTIPPSTTLLGASVESRIAMDHASNDTLTIAAGTGTVISQLTIRPLQANTGKLIDISAASAVVIDRCNIGGGSGLSNGYGVHVDHASAFAQITDCTIGMTAAVSYGVYSGGGLGTIMVTGTRLYHTGTMNGDMMHLNGGTYVVVGNVLDASGITAGTGRCILAAGSYTIGGNRFITPGGGTIQPITPSGTTANGKFLFGNSITASANWSLQSAPVVAASAATHEGAHSQERDVRRYYVTDDSATITVDNSIYGVAEVRRTNNGNQTINGATPPSAGLMFSLVLNNDHGAGGGTITLGAVFKGLAPFTVNANSVSVHTFRSYENAAAGAGSATKYWGFVGSTTNVTP